MESLPLWQAWQSDKAGWRGIQKKKKPHTQLASARSSSHAGMLGVSSVLVPSAVMCSLTQGRAAEAGLARRPGAGARLPTVRGSAGLCFDSRPFHCLGRCLWSRAAHLWPCPRAPPPPPPSRGNVWFAFRISRHLSISRTAMTEDSLKRTAPSPNRTRICTFLDFFFSFLGGGNEKAGALLVPKLYSTKTTTPPLQPSHVLLSGSRHGMVRPRPTAGLSSATR
jgi:hypothetical protein